MRKLINRLLFKMINNSVKCGEKVTVSYKTKVGKNCRLGNFCVLGLNVFLSNNVWVGEYTTLNNITLGENSMLESGIKMPGTGKGRVIIGKECYIGVNNVLDTSDNITIGDFVHIAGSSTCLWCHGSPQMAINSIPLNDPNKDKFRPTAPIIIEDNVWIGGNCTIYPGVIIGHHVIITPNSVVTKNVESYNMAGGVPTKTIKRINGI